MKRAIRFPSAGAALTVAFAAAACIDGGAAVTAEQAVQPAGPVNLRVIAINDFHGALEHNLTGSVTIGPPPAPGKPPPTVPAGGAKYLAAHVANLRTGHPNNIFVSAGDLIGATPLTSALFHDEPTIEVMNMMGLKLSSVGNHEFDEGTAELKRMQEGGCHPIDGCQDGDGFPGAEFFYLGANVVREKNNPESPARDDLTFFDGYKILSFEGAKIAFIGLVLEGTPGIVFPDAVANLHFQDEADSVNALIPEIQAKGVEAIVVVVHEGGFQDGLYNECLGFRGDIIDIVHRLDPAVDAVISGHTHQAYNCLVQRPDGSTVPVTSAMVSGKVVTSFDFSLNRATGHVESIVPQNHVVTQNITPDAAVAAFVDRYVELARPLANRVVGSITATMIRPNRTAPSESPLGDLIADAQLASTAPADRGGAQIALMNPGGIRNDLLYPQSGTEGDGNVTYGEAFAVQPFFNQLMTATFTGAQILGILEQQYQVNPATGAVTTRTLQPSVGFTYTWRQNPPTGEPHAIDVKLNGVAINPAAPYRVTVNSFLLAGGDGFSILKNGSNVKPGEIDIDALVSYLGASSPLSPPAGRITFVP